MRIPPPIDPDVVQPQLTSHYFVNPGVFGPALCACGFVGGNGRTRPLLADHLRTVIS